MDPHGLLHSVQPVRTDHTPQSTRLGNGRTSPDLSSALATLLSARRARTPALDDTGSSRDGSVGRFFGSSPNKSQSGGRAKSGGESMNQSMSATSHASSGERMPLDASAAMSGSMQHAAERRGSVNTLQGLSSIHINSGQGGDLLDSEKRALQRAAMSEVSQVS
ncbi:hypothetical protein T484DRAFT_1832386 [Baffinella frigidus]|nr:hypothetical protein T484DRAFT_1832386 [Cryptophyta sp. CCMP2293]